MNSTGLLDGLRVVEIGAGIAVPYCGKVLRDLGATVVRAEPAGGDPLRRWGTDPDGTGDGVLYRYLNGGKHGRLLDGNDPHDHVRNLVADADIVIEDVSTAGPGATGLPVDVDGWSTVNARVSVVRLSDWGQSGPYSGRPSSGLTVQAAAGWIGNRGLPGREPVMVGGRLHEYAGGAFAAAAALAGTVASRRLGRPSVVDLSMVEVVVCLQAYPMLLALSRAPEAPQRGTRTGRASFPGIMSCKDGLVGINALTGQHWQDMCALLDLPEYSDRQYDLRTSPDVERFFEQAQAWLDVRTVDEVLEAGQSFRVPVAPVSDGAALLRLTQFVQRGFFTKSACGTFVQPRSFYRASTAEPPPPERVVATQPLQSPVPWTGARDDGVSPDGALPFGGLRVLDMTTFWSGPIATSMLGSLGADVVKVESAVRPDGFRFSGAYPSQGERWYERSGIWQAVNLNKRGVSLDLNRPEARDVLARLIAGADVVIENFSPRVLENFGFGYEQVRTLRPDIVMVRMPGYGLEGPWRDFVGWAMAFEQAAGLAWVTGYPDGPPLNPGGAIDPIVGMHALTALIAALEHRRRTGEGQLLEVVQTEVAASVAAEQSAEASAGGAVPGRTTNRDRRCVQGVYPCRGDDSWIAITISSDRDWHELCDVLAVDDIRSIGGADRLDRHDEIDAAISHRTTSFEASELEERLCARGVAAAEVVRGADLYGHPHLEARGFFQEVAHPIDGPRRYPVFPPRFSFLDPAVHVRGAPTLGQHTAEVLAEAGLSADEITSLEAQGLTGTRWMFEDASG